jgi:hypothetical protein
LPATRWQRSRRTTRLGSDLPIEALKPAVLDKADRLFGVIFAETQQAGDYTVVVSATRAGEELGTAKARFLVYEQDLELDNAAADASNELAFDYVRENLCKFEWTRTAVSGAMRRSIFR